jgi:hypothetical protein
MERVRMQIERFLSRSEAAEYLTSRGLRIAKQTLARLAATSADGPVYRIFGSRAVYSIQDLENFAEARLSKPRRSSFEKVAT